MAGKSVKLNDADKNAFKVLKSKGLIPKDWKASGVTDYKRKQIRKAAKEYKQIIKSPKDFTARKVSGSTAEKLKSSGYVVGGNAKTGFRAVLPTKGIEKQHIKNGRLVIHRKRRIETVYLSGGIELLESMAERMDNTPLKDNERWALKIGSKMSFMEIETQSVEDTIDYYYTIEAYLSDQQKQQLQLVKVELID